MSKGNDWTATLSLWCKEGLQYRVAREIN